MNKGHPPLRMRGPCFRRYNPAHDRKLLLLDAILVQVLVLRRHTAAHATILALLISVLVLILMLHLATTTGTHTLAALIGDGTAALHAAHA